MPSNVTYNIHDSVIYESDLDRKKTRKTDEDVIARIKKTVIDELAQKETEKILQQAQAPNQAYERLAMDNFYAVMDNLYGEIEANFGVDKTHINLHRAEPSDFSTADGFELDHPGGDYRMFEIKKFQGYGLIISGWAVGSLRGNIRHISIYRGITRMRHWPGFIISPVGEWAAADPLSAMRGDRISFDVGTFRPAPGCYTFPVVWIFDKL